MRKILFCWIGRTDLNAAAGEIETPGPVAKTVKSNIFDFSEVVLFCNYVAEIGEDYVSWLQGQTNTPIRFIYCSLSSPTNFEEIYLAVSKVLDSYSKEESEFFFQLSSGTPAMAAVWIVLAKAMFPATLIEVSLQQGVKVASFPFDLAADFIPPSKETDERLEKLSLSLPPETSEFEDIIHRSEVMRRVVFKARKAAMRSVPVLIEGQSGTGKELFARAIHSGSSVRDKKFVAVNCGAIPSELVESHLFGHKKGAFTGANLTRLGYFAKANGGTLFLDEIGELPLDAQVKILRVLQEGEIVPVGATSPIKINVRVIAATNRNLIVESQKVVSGWICFTAWLWRY
ncbi:sigma-54 factor interaction domain-containing protein [Maridesulfovibrio sp.]|uniref:sigma-54 factor interaction domain-containing protein n=1 Tax=Maridesulfovibrio sp. TaxID=2795000 RepID=UPI0029CA5077|nr:sigma-54 factor interaction domain-containing protein [Maridesulfovibrio sp.]